jgi:REP element-mobilizing transposase RayT
VSASVAKTVGYHVTWTTYGTWLQGDERGYVKDGEILPANDKLRRDNENRLVKKVVRFGGKEKRIVATAIKNEAAKYKMPLRALAVCSNHVHAVVGCSDFRIESIVRRFKQAGRIALISQGVDGKVWTAGFDKRFCFDEQGLKARIAYVKQHGENE